MDRPETLLEVPGGTAVMKSKFRSQWLAAGPALEHLRYGWIRREA